MNGDGYSDIVIGAQYYDAPGSSSTGRVSVYLGSPSGPGPSPAWTADGGLDYTRFGTSVAGAGDVNGDGYSDLIVGTFSRSGFGAALVYPGSELGLSDSPLWITASDQEDVSYGSSVASAGDVNHDGYADVIVGAYEYTNGEDREGRAWVHLGSASGPFTSPVWMAEGNQRVTSGNWGFGYCVASAGDVDGDGNSDVIVSFPAYSNGQEREGRAYVYLGPLTGASLGGSVTGLTTQKVTCQTAGEKIGYKISAPTWDCEALGLVVHAGDRVQTTARGVVSDGSGVVGGSVTRMTPSSVFCRNLTAGTSVQVSSSATSWDCGALGLAVAEGDSVMTGATGTAD